MSVRYRDFHGTYFVKVGRVLDTYNAVIPGPAGWYFMDSPQFDPIYRALNTYVDLGYHIVEDTLGVYRSWGEPVDRIIYRVKPRMMEYDGTVDSARYGSFLSTLSSAGRILRGGDFAFVPGFEHQTLHPSYHGTIGPRPQDTLLYLPTDTGVLHGPSIGTDWVNGFNSCPGFPVLVSPATDQRLQRMRGSYGLGTGIHFTLGNYSEFSEGNFWDEVIVVPEFVSVVNYLKDVIFSNGNSHSMWGRLPGYYNIALGTKVTEFSCTDPSILPCTMRYHLVCAADFYTTRPADEVSGTTSFWEGDITIRLSYDQYYTPPDQHFANPDGATDMKLSTIGQVKLSYSSVQTAHGNDSSDRPAWDPLFVADGTVINLDITRDDGFVYLSQPGQGDGEAFAVPDFPSFFAKYPIWRYKELVEGEIHSIRNSAYLSSHSALDDFSASIDNNLIEAISELRAIRELLPDFTKAMSSVLALKRGRLITSFKDMMDFLTGLRLLERFGWTPDLELIYVTLPKMRTTMERIRTLSSRGELVGRGDFHYEFPPWEFGREFNTLLTRSKVVVNTDGESVVTRLLGAQALGLLPSASNIWDLIPLSFVVDWFVNIGARLADLESISFLTLMNVKVYVHSYRISSFLTDDELSEFGIRNQDFGGDVDRMRLQVYLRDVSALVPPIRDGRYDFRLPSRPPSWLTGGSLLWQILSKR